MAHNFYFCIDHVHSLKNVVWPFTFQNLAHTDIFHSHYATLQRHIVPLLLLFDKVTHPEIVMAVENCTVPGYSKMYSRTLLKFTQPIATEVHRRTCNRYQFHSKTEKKFPSNEKLWDENCKHTRIYHWMSGYYGINGAAALLLSGFEWRMHG